MIFPNIRRNEEFFNASNYNFAPHVSRGNINNNIPEITASASLTDKFDNNSTGNNNQSSNSSRNNDQTSNSKSVNNNNIISTNNLSSSNTENN